jgi:hypothetical protein
MARRLAKAFTVFVVLIGAVLPAHCQFSSMWVSPSGISTNSGSSENPLREISDALNKVNGGGVISVRDSGGFEGVTIAKNITIDGDAANAQLQFQGIGVTEFAGVRISEGANAVTLNNLKFVINGNGNIDLHGILVVSGSTLNVSNCTFIGAKNGIYFVGGSTLNVENCTFINCRTGINVKRSSTGYLKVSNCTFKNCSDAGIRLNSTSGNVFATIENVEASNCFAGLWGENGTRATLRNSTMNSNVAGVYLTQTGSTSKCVIDNCMLSNNSAGMSIESGGTARVLETSFIQNNILFEALGGVFESDGTNVKISNVTTGPAPGIIPHF